MTTKVNPIAKHSAKGTSAARAISMAEGAAALYTKGKSTRHVVSKLQAAEQAMREFDEADEALHIADLDSYDPTEANNLHTKLNAIQARVTEI